MEHAHDDTTADETKMTRGTNYNSAPARAQRMSWGFIIDGVLLILLSAVVLLAPEIEEVMGGTEPKEPQDVESFFIGLIGVLCIIGGCVLFARVWTISRLRSMQVLYWVIALVPIAVGVILLFWPTLTLKIMVYTVAITLLVRGIVECTLAISNQDRPGWGFLLGHGILGIVLGIVFLKFPWFAPVLLILFLGIDLVLRGATQVGLIAQFRRKIQNSTNT